MSCPRCPSALAMNPGAPLFECWECGQAAEVIWPPQETVHAVERLLSMRPSPQNRNWLPGETLHDLMLENAQHGIYDNLDQLELPDLAFSVDDVGIRADALPVTRGRPFPKAIEGGG